MAKLKLGLYWAASCGGCEISVLEIHERVLDLLEIAEFVFWPCVMDIKYRDVEQMKDDHIDVCLFNGAIRTEENLHLARLLRQKSRVLVAYGSCSMMGGIPGLANLYTREEMFQRMYSSSESTSNTAETRPKLDTVIDDLYPSTLPGVFPRVRTLAQVVDVDYVMPGCPPTGEQTWAALTAIAENRLPPPGPGVVVGAGDKTVCDECPLEKRETRIKQFHRPHEIIPDGTTCLLEQGLVCMGPATRSGCEAACLSATMPCRGCYGPAGDVADQGAKMISVLGSLIDSEDEQEIRACISQVVDPAGTFYRFGLPGSVLGRAR